MAITEAAPGTEDLREKAENLCNRFPSVSAERVLQVLRDCGGHAGYAAQELRALSVDVIKSVDPEDSEHVATLLSNHMLFKQTCRAHYKQFDTNRNGTLEWEELLALINQLCSYMGIEPPGDKSLRSFFDASDVNHDGVLSEREFPRFFESFLRYAFFMQHRRLVGTWRYRIDPNDSSQSEFSISILLGKDYRLHYRSTRGCPGTPKAQQGRQEIRGILELRDGCLQADLKVGQRDGEKHCPGGHESFFGIVKLRFAPSTTEKVIVNFKGDPQSGWGNDVTAKRRQSIEEERIARSGTPTVGDIIRCIAPNGVAYRRSPEFLERTDVLLAEGETVRILERHLDTHWVRTAGGWLPTVDQRGTKLFQGEEAKCYT